VIGLKLTALVFIGLFCGTAVSCGFIAFIIMIGILPRLISKTKTANHVMLYENMVILGVTLGNVVYLYQISLPFKGFGMLLYGLNAGIFIGCLAGALAETVNVIPIISRRLHLRHGLPYAIAALAFGKAFGTIVQWFVLSK
jgi:stage V sporulation protein AB